MALDPQVSIVIPVHNQWGVTAQCLRSIAATETKTAFEVIVVDDASSDETQQALDHFVGVRAVRLDENQGFLGATSAGIDNSRGRLVILLNNDTTVEPKWLDALVELANSDPSIGVVGAKLVYPDGSLQEAGGIIYRDGSGHNYGRGQDQNDPRFNFVREVDYCSGACLLVRREVLDALGGLDPRFAPAYYEDTDLCFGARSLGFRVVYQPNAVVVHLEGASHGTDIAAGIKRYQAVNRDKFADKWSATLKHQPPSDHRLVRGASWRTRSGRLVVVDHQLPMPDQDSGSRRMSELLLLLRDLGFGVTFVPNDGATNPRYQTPLQAEGIEVLGGPGDLDMYLQDLGSDVRIGILSRPTVAWATLPMFRSLVPTATLIYDTVDLHFLREGRRAGVEGGRSAVQSARFHRDMELVLAQLMDAVWVVSDAERDLLLAEDRSLNVSVVPNIHRVQSGGLPFDERQGLLFVGNYHHQPNRDAAAWLVQDILPRCRKGLPGLRLTLAGSSPTDEILSLAGDGVSVTGWVPRLDDLYWSSRLFVAPLRYGAGMKGKIGESLAFGLPVVTTSIGAEGMHLVHEKEAMIAETADQVASAIVAAYEDPDLWTTLARGGKASVARQFEPSIVGALVHGALRKAGVQPILNKSVPFGD